MGARLIRKSLKVSRTADPIMMLGGSPMSVAVPPMFEAKISATRNGYGLTFQLVGDEKRHRGDQEHRGDVVQQCREDGGDHAEHHQDCPRTGPCTRLADQIAMNWNTPLRRVMATRTIMPVSNPRVLKSTPRIAVS